MFELLHISKTGGTALGETLEPFAGKVRKRGHRFTLARVPRDHKVHFVVREPVERFVSGFNSRLRKGLPRHDRPWSPAEEVAFSRFSTPNALAEALSGPAEDRLAAREAMSNIVHTSLRLTDTLGSLDEFESRRGQVAWIGHMPTLDSDFEMLKAHLHLPAETRLPSDPVRSHVTPQGYSTTLSEIGRANLRAWYKDDFPVYEACLRRREELLARNAKQEGEI